MTELGIGQLCVLQTLEDGVEVLRVCSAELDLVLGLYLEKVGG